MSETATESPSEIGSDFTPRLAAMAESYGERKVSSLTRGPAATRNIESSLSFSSRILDRFWQPQRMSTRGLAGSMYSHPMSTTAPSWVFPTPWYADELEWIASATTPGDEFQEPSVISSQQVNYEFVAPSLASDERGKLRPSRRSSAMTSVRRPAGLGGYAAKKRQIQVVQRPLAMEAIQDFTPRALEHLAWADNTSANGVGGSATTFTAPSRKTLRSRPVTPEMTPLKTIVAFDSPRVVDDSMPASIDELTQIVSPKPTRAVAREGISRSAASHLATTLPGRTDAGLRPQLSASPVQAILTPEQSEVAAFDPRSVIATPLILEDGGQVAVFLGGVVAKQVVYDRGGTKQVFSVPSMAYVDIQTDVSPVEPMQLAQQKSNHIDSPLPGRIGQTLDYAASAAAAYPLLAEFAAPAATAEGRQLGLSDSQIVASALLAEQGPRAIQKRVAKLDQTFVTALDASANDTSKDATLGWDNAPVEFAKAAPEFEETNMKPLSHSASPSKLRGAYYLPQSMVTQEPAASDEVKAALRIASSEMVAASVESGKLELIAPAVVEEAASSAPTGEWMAAVRDVLTTMPSSQAASISVRTAAAVSAFSQVFQARGKVPTAEDMQLLAAELPKVYAEAMPTQRGGSKATLAAASSGFADPLAEVVYPTFDSLGRKVSADIRIEQPVLVAPSHEPTYVAGPQEAPQSPNSAQVQTLQTQQAASDGRELPQWFKNAAHELLNRKGAAPEEIVVRELALVNTNAGAPASHMAAASEGHEMKKDVAGPTQVVEQKLDEEEIRKAVRKIVAEMNRLKARNGSW